MKKSRIVMPCTVASLAFAAIALGFASNEPSMAMPSDRPLADAAAATTVVGERRSETFAMPADFERRAQVAGSSAPLGAVDETELQRALSSRGGPGLVAPLSVGAVGANTSDTRRAAPSVAARAHPRD